MKKINRVGEVYTDLKIVEEASPISGHTRYVCECSCEEEEDKKVKVTVYLSNLLSGATTSCGHKAKARREQPDEYHLLQFHRQKKSPKLCPFEWFPAHERKRGHWLAVCCRCGRFLAAAQSDLLSGRRKHCGCRSPKANRRSEGYKRARRSWYDMRRRCTDPKHPDYPRYGGRGVGYDPIWEEFSMFYRDMGDAPEGLSLDRQNRHDHYYRRNCKWSTDEEQAKNRDPRNAEVVHLTKFIPCTAADREAERISQNHSRPEYRAILLEHFHPSLLSPEASGGITVHRN